MKSQTLRDNGFISICLTIILRFICLPIYEGYGIKLEEGIRQDKTRQGRQDKTAQGETKQDKSREDKTKEDKTR